MVKKLQLYLLAFRIECRWRRILRNRRRMNRLLSQREPHTSLRLVRLDMQTADLGFAAAELEKRYCALTQTA